jgi:hypothetical protein
VKGRQRSTRSCYLHEKVFMRPYITFVIVLIHSVAMGQNWALINPAYRYNYSDDGTDTISNQIRVMEVDTLGPDSFRYELNLVGFVCNNSSTGEGEPCNGHDLAVREDQPQFLGYSCLKTNHEWEFNGLDSLHIPNNAGVGASWVFNASGSLMATVDAEWPSDVFGSADTLRRIRVSNGDSILISRSFGIVHWGRSGEDYRLVGVEGAGVGKLFADPLEFFDYQVGDELVYVITTLFFVQPPGGPSYPDSRYHYWTTRITGRSETDDSRSYTTSSARTIPTSPQWGWEVATPAWPMPPGNWLFDRDQVLIDHPILGSYPGQLLDRTVSWGSGIGYLAISGLTTSGRSIMRSNYLELEPGGPSTGIDLNNEIAPGLFGFLTISGAPVVDVWYEEGLGLREARYFQSSVYEKRVSLVGAIIGGDTIISPPNITWTVGMEDASLESLKLYPNPVDQTCFLYGLFHGEQARVFDLEGRIVLSTKIAADGTTLDVSSLAPGTYVVNAEGLRPQRLIIAR